VSYNVEKHFETDIYIYPEDGGSDLPRNIGIMYYNAGRHIGMDSSSYMSWNSNL